MDSEDSGKPVEARKLFIQAWNEATTDSEKLIAAHYVARHQESIFARLEWLDTALPFALKINDDTAKSAFPALYSNIATCYEDLNTPQKRGKNIRHWPLHLKTLFQTEALFITERKRICRLAIYSRQVATPTTNRKSK